jgi:hypothetical protein
VSNFVVVENRVQGEPATLVALNTQLDFVNKYTTFPQQGTHKMNKSYQIPHETWLRVRDFALGGCRIAAVAELIKIGLEGRHAAEYVLVEFGVELSI